MIIPCSKAQALVVADFINILGKQNDDWSSVGIQSKDSVLLESGETSTSAGSAVQDGLIN